MSPRVSNPLPSQSSPCSPVGTLLAFPSPMTSGLLPVFLIMKPLPSAPHLLIYFLSLQVCLFARLSINEITRHVAFCGWLLSLGRMFFNSAML